MLAPCIMFCVPVAAAAERSVETALVVGQFSSSDSASSGTLAVQPGPEGFFPGRKSRYLCSHEEVWLSWYSGKGGIHLWAATKPYEAEHEGIILTGTCLAVDRDGDVWTIPYEVVYEGYHVVILEGADVEAWGVALHDAVLACVGGRTDFEWVRAHHDGGWVLPGTPRAVEACVRERVPVADVPSNTVVFVRANGAGLGEGNSP